MELDFLKQCLRIDPKERWTSDQLLCHPLFDEEFKKEMEVKMREWVVEEEGYNREVVEMLAQNNTDDQQSLQGS